MSAAAERERRATAGKRMTSLVGQAAEDDAAFWGHDTWESDNESFHSSDQESAGDVFDSDFNDSESDHSDEEQAEGAEEERQLVREERKQKSGKNAYVDLAKAKALKKKVKGKKSVRGDGINAGILLNLPTALGATSPPPAPLPAVAAANAALALAPAPPRLAKVAAPLPARSKSRRTNKAPTLSTQQQSQTASETETDRKPPPKKKRPRIFTQEELLLEAANETEPENERWLLGRKRIQNLADDSANSNRELATGKVVERYTSRRGQLNVLTFPEMDHVPALLQRQMAPKPPKPTMCVITGKRARYRDPKTKLGYYDGTAFKELRRRYEAGEFRPQKKAKKATKVDEPTNGTADTSGSTAIASQAPKPPPPSQPPTATTNGAPHRAPTEAKLAPPAPVASLMQSNSTETQTAQPPAAATQQANVRNPQTTASSNVTPSTSPPVTAVGPTAPKTPPPQGGDSMGSQSSADRRSPRRRKPSAKVRDSMAPPMPELPGSNTNNNH